MRLRCGQDRSRVDRWPATIACTCRVTGSSFAKPQSCPGHPTGHLMSCRPKLFVSGPQIQPTMAAQQPFPKAGVAGTGASSRKPGICVPREDRVFLRKASVQTRPPDGKASFQSRPVQTRPPDRCQALSRWSPAANIGEPEQFLRGLRNFQHERVFDTSVPC